MINMELLVRGLALAALGKGLLKPLGQTDQMESAKKLAPQNVYNVARTRRAAPLHIGSKKSISELQNAIVSFEPPRPVGSAVKSSGARRSASR